jgi:REP element-mobilizing transposase RayT
MELGEFPQAYFITFTTYGTRLPGRDAGWVDRRHNRYRTPVLMDHPRLENKMARLLRQQPFSLQSSHRPLVLAAIQEACLHRGWDLQAAHLRTNHVHSVVEAAADPEFVMNTFKAYSSRKLNQAGSDPRGGGRWTRDGSKKYLWTAESVESFKGEAELQLQFKPAAGRSDQAGPSRRLLGHSPPPVKIRPSPSKKC